MPNVLLLHGTGGNDSDYFWFADTRAYLVGKGFAVSWPQLPNTDEPYLETSLAFLQTSAVTITPDTILIGHSSACPLILSWLERSRFSIRQAILVAGFYAPLPALEISALMVQPTYDWQRIKANAEDIILINSDNDPWGCTAAAAERVACSLQVPLIVAYGQGHMGSIANNQPYRKFELLKRLVATGFCP